MKKPSPCPVCTGKDYLDSLRRKFGSDVFVFWEKGKKFVGPEAEDFHYRYVQLLKQIRKDKETYCDCEYLPK